MALTLDQVETIFNSTMEFRMKKGKPLDQHIQEKPLYSLMWPMQKPIPGGDGRVSLPVVMETASSMQGFQYDDSVNYGNPAKVKRVSAAWRLFHIGIKVTMHELIHDGLNIVDTAQGKSTSEMSGREVNRLVDIFQHKLDDMEEGWERDQNTMLWRDGTQDALAYPGVTGWIVDNPAAATVVGGIDQAANPKWRNRANLTITLGAGPETQAVVRTLDYELPQLRRYGGRPNKAFAGSDMIDRLKAEYRAKGEYAQNGFSQAKDLAAGDISFNGIPIHYDPTLDDLGYSKRLYLLDTKHIKPFNVDGEKDKMHYPARPEDKYVLYRAKTWVGGMICDMRNCHGVYAFA